MDLKEMKENYIKKYGPLKPMTPEEVKDYCNSILDAYGIPRDFKPDPEEVKRIFKKLHDQGISLSNELIKMRRGEE